MLPKQPRARRTHLIVGYISIFTLLALVASLGGCNKTQVDRSERPPASPSPKPTGTPAIRDDTPIVVKGGGSIDLEFDETLFTGNPLNCAKCQIKSLTLDQIPKPNHKPSPNPVPCTLPSTTQVITVVTNDVKDKVTITNENGVTIYPAENYADLITQCGDEEKHHSPKGVIKDVTVGIKPNTNPPCDGDGCKVDKKRCRVELKVEYTKNESRTP